MAMDLDFYRLEDNMYWRRADITPEQYERLVPHTVRGHTLYVEWGLYMVRARLCKDALEIYVGGCW